MKKANYPNSKQQGFTLIELIMVIVILGILSAFALPKFADFSTQAENASIEGALGAMKSAAAITRASCLIDSTCSTSGTSAASIEGTNNIATVNGYPSRVGILVAASIDGFETPTPDPVTDPLIISVNLSDSSPCFTYTEATATVAPALSAVGTFDGTDTCVP